jgi:serine/threonine-protein kinase
VLVEMLTGRPPFPGDDATETIAAIVKTQPDLSGVPRVAQRLVGKCLEKDPAFRLRDIGDAWELLADPDTNVPRNGSVRRNSLLRTAGVLLTSVALGLLVWLARGNRELAPQVTRFVDSLPAGRSMPYGDGISKLLALSPDGRALLYRAQDKGRYRLYRRFLHQPYAEPIGDDGAEEPFFSHDGQWVGYRVGTTLKRVPVRGGPAHTIVELPAQEFRGAHWTADGTIIVGGLSRGLWRVSERGGDLATLGLRTDGRIISDPQVLPGGRAILYTDGGADKPDDILKIYDLQNDSSKTLLPGAAGRYLPSGHLVYAGAGTLWAVTFELDRMEVRGTPTPVLEGIREHVGGGPGNPYGVSGIVHAVVVPTGVLAYIPEVDPHLRSTLVWVDRDGREEPLGIEPGPLTFPRVSPEGKRVAFGRGFDKDHDLWIWDVVRRTSKQLTFDSGWNLRHAWFPDGKRLAFSAVVNGINQVFMQSADGSGVPEQITDGRPGVAPTAFSPDGQLIGAELYWRDNMNVDLALLTPGAQKSRRTLWQTPTAEVNAAISPNGRWLAYDSNHLGTFEIFVRPFPNVDDGEYKVTSGGGRNPVWGPGGRELFYLIDRGRMASVMAVTIVPGSGFNFKAPRPAVPGQYVRHGRDTPYDVAPDGRLLLLKPEGVVREEIVTVLNWAEELKRLVPTK